MSVHGYAPYNPKPETAYWIVKTRNVLDEYKDYWPLSVRQIFYRLVADHGYPKSEGAYNRLTGILSRARRASLIPWQAIRDGGLGRGVNANYYLDQEDFEDTIRKAAQDLKLNRQEGQEQVIELWCEAGGMVPILQGIARPYSARVNTGGGYDSVTAKHNLALRVRDRAKIGLRTLILHVGDFDGSGEDMAASLYADVRLMALNQVFHGVEDGPDKNTARDERIDWADGFFSLERVALTAQQVFDRNIETAPPKPSDSRTEGFLERNQWLVEALGTEQISAQLEALTPPELDELLSGAIEGHLDMDIYQGVLDEEQPIRDNLLEWLDAK